MPTIQYIAALTVLRLSRKVLGNNNITQHGTQKTAVGAETVAYIIRVTQR